MLNMSVEEKGTNIDIRTPYNVYLRGFYKRSFAYYTVKERLPVIITQTIDSLVRNKEQILQTYGSAALEELKNVIGELSKLKYEIQTNKPFRNINSTALDAKIYNEYLSYQSAADGICTYYNAVWLHTECYMYRRIREAFEITTALKSFDPFKVKKDEAYRSSLNLMKDIGTFVLDILKKDNATEDKADFINLLKINLWGNKCDLSLSLGKVSTDEQISSVKELDAFILCDNSEDIWKVVSDLNLKPQIDIILDNAGYELFTDFCVADFLITKKYASKIRIYVKEIPWFISDTMTPDIKWFLEQLLASQNESLQELSRRWSKYFDSKTWTIEEHNFWTLPFDYSLMKEKDSNLYAKLSEAKLLIFKGDLSYRKLFGEINWDPETSIRKGLQGFNPTNLCTLRTLKADIICGLAPGVAEKTAKVAEDWLITGTYGVIQFCSVN